MLLLNTLNHVKSLQIINSTTLRIISRYSVNAVSDAPAQKKPKTTPVPKITLITNENVSISTVEEATKLAKRRDLKLVKILDVDTKTQRPLYKLMTGAEYNMEEIKQRVEKKKERSSNAIKGEKMIMVNCNITEHDLMTHVNKVLKWLNKRYEVRVTINGASTSPDKAEKICAFLEANLKDQGRLLQKRIKNNDMKFSILPCREEGGQTA